MGGFKRVRREGKWDWGNHTPIDSNRQTRLLPLLQLTPLPSEQKKTYRVDRHWGGSLSYFFLLFVGK